MIKKRFENIADKDRPIIIIDSGIGGLNVLKEMIKLYPQENFIYFCENKMLPLGNKDTTVLLRRSNRIIKEIKQFNPKSILIACNTIDSVVGSLFDAAFPYIDIFHIIQPTINAAIKKSRKNEIAVLGTKNTIESQSYILHSLNSKKVEIYGIECLDLARAIEEENEVLKTLKKETESLKTLKIDTLILGCTHYTQIKPIIQKDYPQWNIVDSSEELIKFYQNNLDKNLANKANKQEVYIIITQENEVIDKNIKKFIKTDYIKELYTIK